MFQTTNQVIPENNSSWTFCLWGIKILRFMTNKTHEPTLTSGGNQNHPETPFNNPNPELVVLQSHDLSAGFT